ncbi:hypothetical protein BgiBS90_005694, partial [Biomphalaria glabrata]
MTHTQKENKKTVPNQGCGCTCKQYGGCTNGSRVNDFKPNKSDFQDNIRDNDFCDYANENNRPGDFD